MEGIPEEKEIDFLISDNEKLRKERTRLLDTFVALTHALETQEKQVDPSILKENEELTAELKAHTLLLESLKELSGVGYGFNEFEQQLNDHEQEEQEAEANEANKRPKLAVPQNGALKPSSPMLDELADAAQMAVLTFLSTSQTLRGGNWVRAKYPVHVSLPSYFRELKFHYQLGRDILGGQVNGSCVNLRFDMFFPGFSPSSVSEVTWRMFCSEEHARRITRSDSVVLEVLEDTCDTRSGERVKVLKFQNRFKDSKNVQQAALVCCKRRRTLSKSTLVAPQVKIEQTSSVDEGDYVSPLSSSSSLNSSSNNNKKVSVDRMLKLTPDDVGTCECIVASTSSTKLYPIAKGDNVIDVEGKMLQGSICWEENGGTRVVVLISYPADFRYDGFINIQQGGLAFTQNGSVSCLV